MCKEQKRCLAVWSLEFINFFINFLISVFFREREEFVQVAVDKEKQLQASLLHLQAAQVKVAVHSFDCDLFVSRLRWRKSEPSRDNF